MGQEFQKRDSEFQKRDYSTEDKISNPGQEAIPENAECTNNRSTDLQNNRTVDPSLPPCFEELDRKELGTGSQDLLEEEVSALLTLIQDSGIRTNGTIQQTIVSLVFQEGSAAARRLVENSVSAVVEQQKKGNCRNPGGMLVAGLRRGFTANGAKRDARERREPTAKPETEVFGFPIPDPNFNQVAAAIDQALLRGDRGFALGKLQNLWVQGFCDLVEELVITFKRDWQFRLTNQGVQDAHAT
ncbi:MAG: hypothetical protein HC769_33975 [Cyanobacteria bacterium CRU_2_1]|nr:hypothetical protein [Cyanobacteria bacterium CRU_2_1]